MFQKVQKDKDSVCEQSKSILYPRFEEQYHSSRPATFQEPWKAISQPNQRQKSLRNQIIIASLLYINAVFYALCAFKRYPTFSVNPFI